MTHAATPGLPTPLADVSILIVNWNSGPSLARAVDAAVATGADVVVVDNASTDGSADALDARVPSPRLLRSGRNLGFAGGVNLAARHARGHWLLLLNPDTRIDAAAVRGLRDALAARPDAGAAGACLVDAAGEPQRGFTVRRFPTLASFATDLLLVDDVWPGNPARRKYLAADVPLDGAAPFEVDQPAAACLMVRRDAFEALGGLDERFHPAWFEDVDFCRRLRAAGHRILFVPDARVEHEGAVSLRSLDASGFARIWYRNMLRYVRLHHGPAGALVVRVLILAGMVLRLLVGAFSGNRARLAAALAVLRDGAKGDDAGMRSS